MSKTYSCDLCKKVFTQKIDFTRHKNKKTPCISLSEIQEIIQAKEVKQDNKMELNNIFKKIMNILRDSEALTGQKALLNWTPLFVLKLIEHHFGNEIDIDNYEYDFSHMEDDAIENHKKQLLYIARFTNLSNENEDNIPIKLEYLWNDILSKHRTTKNIFLKGKGFNIKYKTTYKKIIQEINKIDLLNTEDDILGNAYEDVIQHIMTGKVFGQFFTMPDIKKLMVNLIDPQIHADGTIETCGDPTMGTGGFLITYLQHILKQAQIKNIKPDWNFIKTEGLYGKEIDEDTYQLAVSNMLISSGHSFEQLEYGDSIREPITRKFDNILANPPFGIKGLKYDDFQSSLKNEYVPIKTDNAVSLFIQAIIYMLKINGKCAIVLPDGQDLLSKSNKTLIAVREFLMKTCDLKEIIYLPAGIFAYTNIKTCIFYFIKKQHGEDVLEFKDKTTKTQRVTGREYKFSKTHQTTVVKFYEYNQTKDEKFLLVEVPIEKIANNSYSLNYTEYMKEEKQEEDYDNEIVMKNVHELFKFHTGPLQAMKCDESNIYPVISSSDIHSHSSFELDEENVFILKIFDGSAGKTYSTKIKYFNGKCNFTSLLYHMSPINKDILNIKYIYYYLTNNVDYISKKYQKGSCNKSLDLDSFLNYKIPIPSLERQESIVKFLDFIYEKSIKTSQEKIKDLKMTNEYCLNNQINSGRNVVKTLGEVCEINQGNSLTKTEMIDGIYDVIGGGKCIGKHNQKNRDGNDFTLTRVGDVNINYIVNPYYLTDNGFSLKSTNRDIMSKYVYYLLSHNKENLLNLYNGTAQKVISKTNLRLLEIPIPSLKRQREIVAYCEANDALIKQLEEEIKRNKKHAQEFMDSIASLSTEDDEQENVTVESSDIIIQDEEDKQVETISDSETTESEMSEENETEKSDETISIIAKPKTKKVKNNKKKLILVVDDNEV
jgi:type I restriction-modification system DNA methylase subunit